MIAAMIILLWSANTSRCAEIVSCPTDRELAGAVQRWENDVYRSAHASVFKESPGHLLMMTPQTIKRIKDVYCGERQADERDVVYYKFTAVRGLQIEYYASRLQRTAAGWTLVDPVIVIQKMKRR